MSRVLLRGIRSRPLSSYLAALGILRLVALQTNPDAGGRWRGDVFELDSDLDADGLVDFFLYKYSPSPLVAPWNGSDQGGFKPGAESRASRLLELIAASATPRLADYRAAIARTKTVVAEPLWQEAHHSGEKRRMVLPLRNTLPDQAIVFLDASVALTADDIAFPPILGTGGNIGRLDLVTNYMEHLRLTIAEDASAKGKALAEGWLRELLDGTVAMGVKDASPGQFDPVGVGGPNQGRGVDAPALTNPFAFVLTMEGSLLLAASATRRLGSSEAKASAPFTVNGQALGFGSAAFGEEGKGELWAPLWSQFLGLRELEALMAEGRATWEGEQARSATDFLRATRTLGTDRGITAFERYSFVVRNGRSPVAVPVGRVVVQELPEVALTAELDPWLAQLRRGNDDKVPAGVRVARQKVERALFNLASRPNVRRFRELLVAAAAAERAVQRSSSFRRKTGIGPVPPLARDGWCEALQDGSPECQLAWSLVSGWDARSDNDHRAMRDVLRGVRSRSETSLQGFREDGPNIWGLGERPVAAVLADVAVYRCRTSPGPPDAEDPSVRGVRPQFRVAEVQRVPSWVAEALAAGNVDLEALGDWLAAALLVAPGSSGSPRDQAERTDTPEAVSPLWRLLAPWWGQERIRLANGQYFVPVVRPSWAARIQSGHPSQMRSVANEAGRLFGAAAGRTATRPDLITSALGDRGASLLLAALMVPTRSRDLAGLIQRNVFLPDRDTYLHGGAS